MRFCETSAKDGTNVNAAFYDIARDVVAKVLAAGGDAYAGSGGSSGGASSSVAVGAGGKKGDAAKGGKGHKDCALQ